MKKKQFRTNKICDNCGKKVGRRVQKRVEPFLEDIETVIKWVYLHDACYESLVGAI